MMSLRHPFGVASILAILMILSPSPAWTADLVAQLNLSRCGGSPEERVAVSTTSDTISFTVRPLSSGSVIRLHFKQPLLTRGKERLLLEGRGDESSGEGVSVARIRLLGEKSADSASYEPDLRFPPEWNLRTILFSEFDKPVPERVTGIEIQPWMPNEVSKRFTLHLRRAECWSREEVAAALRLPARPPRTRAQTPTQPIPPADQRWTSLGPGGGGWYRTVAFSPHDGACFVGADVGGIYRSTDNCRTWRMMNDGVPNLYVNCFAFHPTDGRIVFAGCNGGVLRSTDGGRTWQVKRGGFPPLMTFGQSAPISAILVDPELPNLVYAGVGHGGVLKSTDGGATWKPGNQGLPAASDCWRLIPHPRDPQTYYAGWHRKSGLFVTHDCGATWQALNLGGNIHSAWFFIGENVTGLDIDPRNPERLVYCNDMDLYQTLDGGKSWDQVATDLVRPATADQPAVWRGRGCEVLCSHGPQALAVDPSNPQTLYFGYMDAGAWKSEDGGRTCYRLTDGLTSGYGRMGCVALDPADSEFVYLSSGSNYDLPRVWPILRSAPWWWTRPILRGFT